MSSQRSYSKESRSYYSRSSSHGDNRSSSLSSRHRPLSSLLTERDFSPPSRALDLFDDPFFFENRSRRFRDDFDRRLRWRFEDETFDDHSFQNDFNHPYDFGRNIPINYQGKQNSYTALKNIPVQQSSYRREQHFNNNNNNNQGWSSNSFERNQQNSQNRENRISTNAWPSEQESPTRKRTSMTIFVRQPRLQYSEVSQPQRPMSTSNYQSTKRTNYY